MADRRSYDQYCGVARALDLVGERWTLLIVREMLLAPRRFSELAATHPGLTSNLLAKRLVELVNAGIVMRTEDGHYALTALGAALEPVVMELGRWGNGFLGKARPTDRADVGWLLLGLQRRFRPGWIGQAELRIEDGGAARTFALQFLPERLRVREMPAERPAVVVSGQAADVRAWLFDGASARELRAHQKLAVAADDATWLRFTSAIAGLQ